MSQQSTDKKLLKTIEKLKQIEKKLQESETRGLHVFQFCFDNVSINHIPGVDLAKMIPVYKTRVRSFIL